MSYKNGPNSGSGRVRGHPMELMSEGQARQTMEKAGLKPARLERNGYIFMSKDENMRRGHTHISWTRFFGELDKMEMGVFADPITGYLKIMRQKNQRVVA